MLILGRALKSLDQQLEMVKKGTHPQLVSMLESLARRADKQLARVEARHVYVYRFTGDSADHSVLFWAISKQCAPMTLIKQDLTGR
jgi:hypothetical protein